MDGEPGPQVSRRTRRGGATSRQPPAAPLVALCSLAICALVLSLSACGAARSGGAGREPTSTVGPIAVSAGAAWSGRQPVATASAASPRGTQQFQRLPYGVGRLVVTRLDGARSGVSLRVWVWLPPQYDEPAFAHDLFPALMLYPGGTGAGHNGWVGPQLGAKELVAAQSVPGHGSLLPFVLVMPEMQVSPQLDTECADLPGLPKVGTFLADDVRAMVLDNFRVSPDRVSWGAAGTSSGAYCAMRIVFTHPDRYAAVVSIDGYFTIDTPLPEAKDPAVLAADPQEIARLRPPPVSVLLWSGTSGHDLARSRHFLALVRPPTSVELRDIPGAQHLTVDMARMVPDSLAFLSARLAPPTATLTPAPALTPAPVPAAG